MAEQEKPVQDTSVVQASSSQGVPVNDGAAEPAVAPATEPISGKDRGGKFDPAKQYVPYERFQQVEAKVQELQQRAAQPPAQAPGETDAAFEHRKTEFWKDPHKFVEETTAQIRQELGAQFREEIGFQQTLGTLRGLPTYSPDLENAMIQAINTYGLQATGKTKAVQVAYKMVTGQDLTASRSPQTSNDGYETRQVKERLMKPTSTGGASNSGQAQMSLDQLRGMPLKDFGEDPEKYVKQILESRREG